MNDNHVQVTHKQGKIEVVVRPDWKESLPTDVRSALVLVREGMALAGELVPVVINVACELIARIAEEVLAGFKKINDRLRMQAIRCIRDQFIQEMGEAALYSGALRSTLEFAAANRFLTSMQKTCPESNIPITVESLVSSYGT
jgi:hypothetical protein